jgi:hypothetical protein
VVLLIMKLWVGHNDSCMDCKLTFLPSGWLAQAFCHSWAQLTDTVSTLGFLGGRVYTGSPLSIFVPLRSWHELFVHLWNCHPRPAVPLPAQLMVGETLYSTHPWEFLTVPFP